MLLESATLFCFLFLFTNQLFVYLFSLFLKSSNSDAGFDFCHKFLVVCHKIMIFLTGLVLLSFLHDYFEPTLAQRGERRFVVDIGSFSSSSTSWLQ